MGTLTVNGRKVTVDDSFANLTPEQQQATVDEIAASMGGGESAAPQAAAPAAPAAPPAPTAQERYDSALGNVRKLYPNMSDKAFEEYAHGRKSISPMSFLGNIPILGPILAPGTGDRAGALDPYTPQQLAQNAQIFSAGDEISSASSALTDAAMGKGNNWDAYQELNQARQNLGREQAGGVGQAAEIVGGLTSLGPGTQAVSTAAQAGNGIVNMGKSMLGGAATGGVMGAAYGMGATEGDLGQRLEGAKNAGTAGAIVGGTLPAVFGAVANKAASMGSRRAVNQAIKNAPDASDLKAASSALFKKVDDAGITVNTEKFSGLVNDLVSNAKKMRISESLDPKAHASFMELIGALDDVQRNGGKLTISDLHTLRQIAQKAAQSSEGRDAMFAGTIIDGLDNFVTKSSNINLPANRIGNNQAGWGNDLMQAISTWGRARRVGKIEEAIYRAGLAASGEANGLRIEFRRLLKDEKTRKLFTETERKAMEEVANGTSPANIANFLGKFGFGSNGGSNMLGGLATFGVTSSTPLGIAGGLAATTVGTAARHIAPVLARRAANRAAQVVATPGIQEVPQAAARLISGTTLPLLGAQRTQ